MSETTVPIVIVEDTPDIFDYLRDIITEHEGFEYTGGYRNGEDALAFLPKSKAKIAIMDIRLPGINGIECVRKLKPLRPEMKFLMYTVVEDSNKIFESLKAGANGYILKEASRSKIISSIEDLIEGGAPMSGSIARKVIEFFQEPLSMNKEMEVLTDKEINVLGMLSKGLLYREIADELGIKEGTVKIHIHHIYQKLHVRNRTEAIDIYKKPNR
ncbi:MAG: response regulator transcription factor [Saprospiraceae bacterium]|nr:response regulator transcription factor [Saprospiraceae bacterium]